MIYKAVLLLMFVSFSGITTAEAQLSQDVSIVEKGQTKYVILINQNASEIVRFAAEELRNYIRQMTGAQLSIVQEAKSNDLVISIGQTDISKAFRISLSMRYEGDDQFLIVSRESSLILLGTSERANLYAVYHLLDYWGCRWLMPAFGFSQEFSEYIPRNENLSRPAKDVHERPSLRYRMAFCVPGFWKADVSGVKRLMAIVDWMTKQKLNVIGIHIKQYENVPRKIIEEIARRGLDICAEGHSWAYFISMKEKEFQRKYCSNKKTATNYLVSQIRGFGEQYNHIKLLGPWGRDNSTWCVCRNCWDTESPSSRAAMFYQCLWKQLKDSDIDVRLLMIGYQSFLFPPEETEFPKDTLIYICPIDRDYGKVLSDPSSKNNTLYASAIDAWIKVGFLENLIHYTYYRKHCWHSLPVNIPSHMAAEMVWIFDKGFVGASTYLMDQDWLAYYVQHLMYAKLCWNVHSDPHAILMDYMKAFCGDSWKYMCDIYQGFEVLCCRLHGGGYFGYNIRGLARKSVAISSDSVKKLEQMLRSIETAKNCCVSKPSCIKLLELTEHWILHWLFKLRASIDFKVKKNVSGQSFNNLLQLLQETDDEGLVYKGLVNNKEIQKDKSKL